MITLLKYCLQGVCENAYLIGIVFCLMLSLLVDGNTVVSFVVVLFQLCGVHGALGRKTSIQNFGLNKVYVRDDIFIFIFLFACVNVFDNYAYKVFEKMQLNENYECLNCSPFHVAKN